MADTPILLAVIGRPHGVRGLVRVQCHAADPASLEGYDALFDDRGRRWTLRWRGEGIAELRDADGRVLADRDAAQAMVNQRLSVERAALPETDDGEFYHTDLIGLEAFEGDRSWGRVKAVHDFGAGTILEIGAGLMLPFTLACVPVVDLAGGRITVSLPDELEVPGELEDSVETGVTP
ncbi:ribosomal RNA small subunit 16S rRNA processing protein RimM [Ameyamaea chiangmaiensis NBRC 103196]|uniref:Ribosome maturation factor RimM n=1 Tax=Ameyamaea chiangmaiensis TaxID=442969 RepID=A0A850PAL9_9PROT|nr:ribosome maturation factor RimM [Ameyamaea chiangmaiensis]MBS4074109.1 16S rRNA processing protein RimM [Ameyamaea chiangmaiensis]NVN40998.1 16S rRNA processing protein RimM [Ameyamaea chiangmaiensis]GBQ67203.1 ribosomal RNA small subunit 16S rRNA processing protein RimM [Ameyamaea chiangmaiensis NBRC 103196]